MEGVWFKSSKFQLDPDEDKETNPKCYGESLANWLRDKLGEIGYITEVIPEDWGWCVICSRDPFLLWIGCGNVDETMEHDEMDQIPNAEDITWHCFTEAEVSLFKKLFKKIDTSKALEKLNRELREILKNEKSIQFTDEP